MLGQIGQKQADYKIKKLSGIWLKQWGGSDFNNRAAPLSGKGVMQISFDLNEAWHTSGFPDQTLRQKVSKKIRRGVREALVCRRKVKPAAGKCESKTQQTMRAQLMIQL